ncbi:glycoside hydrolase family 78 protein [Streptomyces shenzhenensis]
MSSRSAFFHVESADSVLVPWPAAPLEPREAREVRVRVIGADGETSDWSDIVTVERGLTVSEWQAALIEPAHDERGPAALLRRSFTAQGDVVRARLHITASKIPRMAVLEAFVRLAPIGGRRHHSSTEIEPQRRQSRPPVIHAGQLRSPGAQLQRSLPLTAPERSGSNRGRVRAVSSDCLRSPLQPVLAGHSLIAPIQALVRKMR